MPPRRHSSSHVSVTAASFGLIAALGLAGIPLVGCDNQPTKDKAKAEVSEARPSAAPAGTTSTPPAGTATTAATATAAGASTHRFGPADSSIGFVGAKVTGKHEGSFGAFSGSINLVDNDPAKSTVSAEIDTASLKIDSDRLAKHLRSPDFFDVEKFPKATFTSTAIKAGGDKGATHTVTGNLVLHGVTKSVSFPATIKIEGGAIQVSAEFGINRKDFGILYAGKADDLIKDDVLIKLNLKATKPA
jgi:polyisoprenoid-binding protein YceI